MGAASLRLSRRRQHHSRVFIDRQCGRAESESPDSSLKVMTGAISRPPRLPLRSYAHPPFCADAKTDRGTDIACSRRFCSSVPQTMGPETASILGARMLESPEHHSDESGSVDTLEVRTQSLQISSEAFPWPLARSKGQATSDGTIIPDFCFSMLCSRYGRRKRRRHRHRL